MGAEEIALLPRAKEVIHDETIEDLPHHDEMKITGFLLPDVAAVEDTGETIIDEAAAEAGEEAIVVTIAVLLRSGGTINEDLLLGGMIGEMIDVMETIDAGQEDDIVS